MHPLEALGLERDADERAVKRAYAQRLKVTRPDEDPAGFQKLHETYQAALSFLRWRAENPDATWWEDEDEEDWDDEDEAPPAEPPAGMPQAEFEALIGNPRYVAEPEPVSEPDTAPRPSPQVERVREDIQPFSLDLGDFLRRLFERADEDLDETRLRSWLEQETADWPLAVKPRVAHDLLYHMLETRPALTPEQLEVVVTHFGLDDVQTGVDPIGLEELRIEASRRLRQRSAKFAHLFAPGNRDELCRYMAQPERGSHPAFVTRLVTGLLTGRNAYEWAFALRPIPFVNRFVMGFLRDIDDKRFDAFGPHVDGMALQFWEWAEMRREANRGFRWVVAIVALLGALAYVTKDAPKSPGYAERRPGRTVLQREDRERQQQFAERIRKANAMELAQGLAEYERLISDLPPPPWAPAMEEIAALVHYNRAVILAELKRPDEARPGYEGVDRLFGRSVNWPVQLVTAKALVNLGYLLDDRKEHREALAAFGQVVARYGALKGEQFDLQVAKALSARADAFRQLGEMDEARHALDDLLRRFGDRTEGELGKLVAAARQRRADP